MLFNKNSAGTAELKARIGFLYASNNFDNIKTDIEIAEEEIIELIGQAVYNRANAHYISSSYEKATPSAAELLNDNLVHHIQLPVALFAYKEFSANRDVSHEDGGRKVKISSENEKIPFEWMLDRDEASVLRKAHKTTDRLIAFLEKNEASFTEWKDSASQVLARSLFINTAKDFDQRFPIDKSRMFFLKILPFMQEVENTTIKAVLNTVLFDAIKEEIKDGTLTGDNPDILELIKPAVAYLTMAKAVKRLSLQVIPEGVIQNYMSERLTTQAKQVPMLQLMNDVAKDFQLDGEIMLSALEQYLVKLIADEAEEEYTPDSIIDHNDIANKHFRV